jgi:site-specific recombinase XerD
LNDLIKEFAEATHDYHDISDERRKMQLRVLHELDVRVGAIEHAGAADVLALLTEQLQSGLKPTTVRKHLGAIRPFFRWGHKRKPSIFSADVVMDVRDIKPPRGSNGGVPRPYSRKEMRRFWTAFDERYPKGRPNKVDDYLRGQCGWKYVQAHAKRTQALAIVALALYGGARKHEIWDVDLDDLSTENSYVPIWGARKNPDAVSENRVIPWMGHMRTWIGDWLELREKLAPEHDHPWLSLHTREHSLKPMQYRTFEMLLTNLPGHWEFHRLRHTMATEYLRGGGKLHALQKILGHKRIEQTLAYAQLLNEDILRDAERIDLGLDDEQEAA